MDEENERILALSEALLRQIRIYFLAHGQHRDTLYEVLTAIMLIHADLCNGDSKP
jgi:hypothetical protein